jgi:hypothetical protein
MVRLALALPVCGCVLALAACGGSGGLTKAQYDAKVSHLCLLAADHFRELHMDYSVLSWRHSGADAVRITQHFDRAVAALKAPSSIAADATAFLSANKKVAADYRDGATAASGGNPATIMLITRRLSLDGAATSRGAKKIRAAGCYLS